MLATGEIYHVLNKGIENRLIFQNKRDYERFLTTLLECNDVNLSPDIKHRRRRIDEENINIKKKKPLVEILCFCLMPNHFHIALKQVVDGGVAKFMQRVGNSYTKYFNIKNNRKGSLFMSRYKSVHVSSDSQIRHLITYIHANPLDLYMPLWRTGKIKNLRKAKDFLENYTWSSYQFFTGQEGLGLIKEIIKPKIVNIFYKDKKNHFGAIISWSSRYFDNLVNIEC